MRSRESWGSYAVDDVAGASVDDDVGGLGDGSLVAEAEDALVIEGLGVPDAGAAVEDVDVPHGVRRDTRHLHASTHPQG